MNALMIMGTGSDVGKSLIVAGLCRAFKKQGLSVAPFKPQNMSNNAAVTVEGGEIGRAQALQARAAGLKPTIHMNPVLLKPESETGAQVIVQGKRAATMKARDYFKTRSQFMPQILESFQTLSQQVDIVLVEGAGSPAEVNLRTNDLANLGFAEAANLPAILLGDIHRGGVIASVVGTKAVLNEEDAKRIKAFIINNFHGDPSLFDDGLKVIEEKTNWRSAGVIPHFEAARNLPAEDALALDKVKTSKGTIKIAVPRLSRIANFDDLDPLRLEEDVAVMFIQPGDPLPGDADLVLLPGSKSTIADMAFFRAQGWDIDLHAHVRRGGRVLGLCGGYQMLGEKIHDPLGLESSAGSVEGLGLLKVETTLSEEKSLVEQKGIHLATRKYFAGYEMHLGVTTGTGRDHPFAQIDGRDEGAVSSDGLIAGTYLHGLFSSDDFRRAYLSEFGLNRDGPAYETVIETTLDALAEHLNTHVNLDLLLDIAHGRSG